MIKLKQEKRKPTIIIINHLINSVTVRVSLAIYASDVLVSLGRRCSDAAGGSCLGVVQLANIWHPRAAFRPRLIFDSHNTHTPTHPLWPVPLAAPTPSSVRPRDDATSPVTRGQVEISPILIEPEQ